jgi:hypothetical protein
MYQDYYVTFSSAFDVHIFPYDNQDLIISGVILGVSPGTIKLMQYDDDIESQYSNFKSSLWSLRDFSYEFPLTDGSQLNIQAPDEGDMRLDLTENSGPEFKFAINVERNSYSYAYKYIFPLAVIDCTCWITYFVPHDQERGTFTVSLMLAAIALMYVIGILILLILYRT